MWKLGALALALGLTACTVSVTFYPPRIANLSSQPTYCTDRPTWVDFSFVLDGLLTRLEVYILDEGRRPESALPVARVDYGGLVGFGGRVYESVYVTPSQLQALVPQGIIVEPLYKRLWVRGFNPDGPSGYVRSDNLMAPSSSPYCDP